VAVRFASSSRVKNDLPRYSNFWDGTTIYSPFTATGSYDALASYTVPSGGVSTITFAGLPTGGQYTHLQLRVSTITSVGGSIIRLRINGDSSANYVRHVFYGGGGSASAGSETGMTVGRIFGDAVGTSTTAPTGIVLDLLDYASVNKNKVWRLLSGSDQNGSGEIQFYSGMLVGSSASAVNSLQLTLNSGNFSQHSQFALYGIRG